MSDPPQTVDASLVLDAENPWPGLDSFDEHARRYFHGRDDEAEALLRRVTDAQVLVLFGKSGLGKTSLLKAGLFPRLRNRHYLPIYVRLAIRPDAPPFTEQVGQAMRDVFESEGVDAPSWPPGQSLWEFLHRRDLELWSSQNFPLVPVIVFDQFEELFTLGEAVPEAVAQFKIELADLAENRIPEALATRLASDAELATAIDVRAVACKFIVSLREDFLPELEAWHRALPSLGRTRLRLLPMRLDQAMSAVHDAAPHLMDEAIARRIVEFVAAAQVAQSARGQAPPETMAPDPGHLEIEPALLSLFCRGLNDRRRAARQARFDADLLEGAKQGIISDYYRSCVEGLPDSCSRFIETELITERGFRNSYSREDAVPALVTAEQLDYLITRRLLRVEERYGTERIELTHDLLTRAVLEHRTQRRQRDQEQERTRQVEAERESLERETRRQRARFRVAVAVAAACLLLAAAAGYQWRVATAQRERADEALRESQARDLANQSLLIGTTDPVRALELALSAIELKETQQSALALRLAFARARLRAVLLPLTEKSYVDADVSPAGNRIAFVRQDGAIDVRTLPSLALLHSRPGAAGSPARSAYFTADGNELFVVAPGAGVSRWNPDTGRDTHLFTNQDLGDRWRGADRGRLLIRIGNRFRSLLLSSGLSTPLPNCPGSGTPLAATLTNSGLVAAFIDGLCVGSARRAVRFSGDERPDWVRLSPDGSRLATSNNASEIVRIWDVAAAKEIAAIQGFTAVPSSIAFMSPNDVAIGVYDGMVELWHLPETTRAARPDRIEQLSGATEGVHAIFSARNGQWIITIHDQGTVRVWQGLSSRAQNRVAFGSPAISVGSNARGALAMIIGRRLSRIDQSGRQQALSSPLQPSSDEPALVVSRSHDRTHAVTAWSHGLVQVWSLDDGRLVAEFREGRPLTAASWVTAGCPGSPPRSAGERGPDDAPCVVATVDADRVLRVHPIGGPDLAVRRWTLPPAASVDGAISRDRRHWIEETDGGLKITDLQTGSARVVTVNGTPIRGWQFGRDGGSLVSRDEFSLRLQSLVSADEVKVLRGHAASITSAVMSADGARVLTASGDWTARLWDASTGALLNTLRGHSAEVTHAIFNRDGSLIATTGRDRTLRIWEAVSGTQVFRFELGDADAGGTLDDFNGPSVVYRPDNETALLIDCEPCLPLTDLRRIGRQRVNDARLQDGSRSSRRIP